jgi:hypothetical protein
MQNPSTITRPEALGLIVREYLTVRRLTADAGPRSFPTGAERLENAAYRGVQPKRRFCLISSATAGGT